MSPMCMYSSHEKDGKVQPFHMTHYISRAVGQVGLIMVEATAVTPQGRISDQDLGIWDDAHIDGLAALTSQIKTYGSKTPEEKPRSKVQSTDLQRFLSTKIRERLLK